MITTFQQPSSPRLSRPGGWRPYIFPLLFTQAGSPTCLNTSILLVSWLNSVFRWFSSSLTPLSLASCFAKRATVTNPFSLNNRRLGIQFAVREYIRLASLPSRLRIGFLSSTGHGRIRHSPPLLSAWWWYPTH